jgi:hypothetical protein
MPNDNGGASVDCGSGAVKLSSSNHFVSLLSWGYNIKKLHANINIKDTKKNNKALLKSSKKLVYKLICKELTTLTQSQSEASNIVTETECYASFENASR